MDTETLDYFIVAAEAESLSQACEHLKISQSALSYKIRTLEDELQVELFKRTGRRLRLSPVGKIFLEDARKIVSATFNAKVRFARAMQGAVGELRVGFETIASRNRIVSASLLQFREKAPDVTVLLVPATVDGIRAALLGGEIDVAFVQIFESDPDLSAITYQQIDWLLALSRTHRLALAPSICLADLRDEPFIWRPRSVSPIVYDRMLAACIAKGLVPNIVQEAYNEDMMVNLVSVGMGVSFLVETTEEQFSSAPVAFRKVEDFSMPINLSAVWRRDNPSAALRQFLEMFVSLNDAQLAHSIKGRGGRTSTAASTVQAFSSSTGML
jgi:DNA-binding transcriptional LysR family regulator